MEERRCSKCRETKRESEFHKGANWCKKCRHEYRTQLYADAKRKGLCPDCRKESTNKYICDGCLVKRDKYKLRIKREVLEFYGGRCFCCSEADLMFLTIDHVNDDGYKHRKELGGKSGLSFYLWLRRNDYPSGYQVACWNCNCARRLNNGICPHQL